MLNLRIGQECGSKWYRLSSWRFRQWDFRKQGYVFVKGYFRKLKDWPDRTKTIGFAVGPILVWWG